MRKVTCFQYSLFFLLFTLFSGCQKSYNINISSVPLPPTELRGAIISSTKIRLDWVDKSTNEVGFKIERKTALTQYTILRTVGADTTSYIDFDVIPGTTYTYRVYAFNSVGASITYTNEVTLSTLTLPILTTNSVSNITGIDANSGGNIISDGGGAIISRGVVWSTSTGPTISLNTKTSDGNGSGNFSSYISDLSISTKYYVRAYATNSAGTSYGNEVVFNTNTINIKNGLIAYYPFTGNPADSSGNNYHGLLNGPTLTSDRFGNQNRAYSFDGKTSNIFINNAFFDIGWNQFSISCWYYLNKISNINNTYSSHILFNSSPHNGIALDINWGDTKKYNFWLGTPASGWSYFANATSNQDATATAWKHVVLVKNQNSFSLYIDGKLDKIFTSANPILSGLMKIYLGSTDPLTSNEVFDGKLDDFRFYNRALSEDEIVYLSKN